MSVEQRKYPDAVSAAQACARQILELLKETLSGERLATLAVSGGSTPKPMFQAMARSGFEWDRVHLFWVDERAVPPTDSQSNYKLAYENFISPAGFPEQNVHRVQAELGPQQAAATYEQEIREFFDLPAGELPHFDVIHCGVGPDGHTASLFPGEPLIEDRENIAAAVYVEKFAQWRITLLPGVLAGARNTVVLACGPDKADAVRAILNGPYDPVRWPGQIASRGGQSVTWFMDDAAAGGMD
jgi:6-phosphogluconolactonase